MGMSSDDSPGVTLALVDPSLLSSWEGMVKRGVECSLLLKHSKGKIIATLQSTTPSPRDAKSEEHEERRAPAIFPPAVLIFGLPTQKICLNMPKYA